MEVTWDVVKDAVDNRSALLQWVDVNDRYEVIAFLGQFKLKTTIIKDGGTAQTEFEASYKSAFETNQTPIDKDFVAQAVSEARAFTFTTGLGNIAGNTEQPLALLTNPSGSGKKILVTHFLFGTDSSNVRSIWRAYKNPTVTANGTALTIVNTYIKPSPMVSAMEAYHMPTVSANGTALNMAISPANAPSRGVSRWYFMEPGNSLLVTIENSQSNADSFGDVYWVEGV